MRLVIKVGLTLLEYQNSKLGAAGSQDQILKSFEFLAKEFGCILKPVLVPWKGY